MRRDRWSQGKGQICQSLVTDDGQGVKQAGARTPSQLLTCLRQSGRNNREQTGGESEGGGRGHHLLVTSSRIVSCFPGFH